MTKLKKLMLSGSLTTAAVVIAFAGTAFASNGNGYGAKNEIGQHQYQLTDTEKAEREVEMQTKITTAFNTAETAGKITTEQKAKLLELHEAVHVQMQAGNRDAAETAMKTMHDWMTSENIDASVMPEPLGGNGKGSHSNGVHNGRNASINTASTK